MAGPAIEKTAALVLRKTRYSESSLIIATLTPDHGQLHFLVRGALRPGRRRFPEVDLFRRLNVVYRPSRRSDLHSVREATCTTGYDAVARRGESYRLAGWLARLCLANSVADSPCPRLFAAAETALARLCAAAPPPAAAVVAGVTLTLLDEEGMLPPAPVDGNVSLAPLLAWATDATRQQPYAAADCERLARWATGLFAHRGLRMPDG